MKAGPSASYMPQLDGLRALAVGAVAWHHWRANWFSPSPVPWGELGVEIFFVISGFLITGILLDNRQKTDPATSLKQFYVRRVLRIFPVYYATLLVALLWHADGMKDSWPWHFSYLSNIYFFTHDWTGQLSHFWSLAVEEQFYLFWPLLIILLPERFLLPAILIAIAIAPAFESVATRYLPHARDVSGAFLMPSCLGALGLGALLSFGVRKHFPMTRLALVLLAVGLCGSITCTVSNLAPAPLSRFFRDCILAWVVFSAANGFRGPAGWLLGSKPLRYLGRISYGSYLFHNFASPLWIAFLELLRRPAWLMKGYEIPAFQIPVFAALTIGLAAYSWHRFEKPIIDLKRKFPYPKTNPPKTDAALRQ